MGETITFPTKLTIRYTGLFDFDGLFNLIISWLKVNRYWVHENKYKHKVPSPLGAEQEIGIYGDRKVNEFIKYKIKIDFHLWDMTEVEVEQKGAKKKLISARLEMKFTPVMSVEYQNRFQKSKWYKLLYHFYRQYIIKEEVESIYGDTLYYRMNKLHTKVKEFLDMEAKAYEFAGYLGDNV